MTGYLTGWLAGWLSAGLAGWLVCLFVSLENWMTVYLSDMMAATASVTCVSSVLHAGV